MRQLCFLLLVILIESSCAANPICGKTKRACKKIGGYCEHKGGTCDGAMMPGKKYCQKFKECDCCVPPIDCTGITRVPCLALNGTCIAIDEKCDGRVVRHKAFCKSADSCKCCFPDYTISECPFICPEIYDPVCASDGMRYKTYANRCFFQEAVECDPEDANMKWIHDGECVECLKSFIRIGNSCYYFSNVTKNWQGAREFCHTFPNTDLAVFDREPEDYRILFNYMTSNGFSNDYIHVGASDRFSEGNWNFVDGRLVDITAPYWGYNEPINPDYNFNYACIFRQDSYIGYRWKMGDCDGSDGYFICQQGVVVVTG